MNLKQRQLEAEMQKQQQKRLLQQQEIEKQTTDIIYYGLWQFPSQVEQKLLNLPTISQKKGCSESTTTFQKKSFKTTICRGWDF